MPGIDDLVRERFVQEYVPVIGHVSDRAVLLESGAVFTMLEVAGVSCGTQDNAVLNEHHDKLAHLMFQVADHRLTWWVWDCRYLIDPRDYYPSGYFRSSFATALDIAYRDRLADRFMYGHKMYIGLEWHAGATKRTFGNFGRGEAKRQESQAVLLERLEDIALQVCEGLRPWGATRLGRRQEGALVFSEIAEALMFAMTGVRRKIGETTGRLGDVMFREDIIAGHEAIEIRDVGKSTYAACLGWKYYPAQTTPGMLDRLLDSQYRRTVCHHFRFLRKPDAMELMTRKQNKMMQAGDRARSQVAELDEAADHLQSNRFSMGEHAVVCTVFADDITNGGLADVVTAAVTDFSDCGATIARERRAIEAAYFSMLPGNAHLSVHPGGITDRNFACMAPLHSFPVGDKAGYWGQPVAIFRTAASTPLRFHMHVRDLGNVFISGRAGSGKSTMLAFLACQLERCGAQMVIWDKDRGLEICARALHGRSLRLRAGEAQLAPLKALSDSPEDISFLQRLTIDLISSDGRGALAPEEQRRIGLGLYALMTQVPPQERSFGELRAFLDREPEGAGARLEKWCAGREYGWVLDGDSDQINLDAPVVHFDMTDRLADAGARGPTMAYLFHVTSKLLDGRRLVSIVDEFWRYLLDDVFADYFNDALKTRRKLNSPVILATQSVRDALRSRLAHTIFEQAPTKFAFAVDQPSWSDYGPEGMGFTLAEFEIVRTLSDGTGTFLLKQGRDSVEASLPLRGLDHELTVLSGRERSVRLLDQLRAEIGEEPDRLIAEFQRRGKDLVT